MKGRERMNQVTITVEKPIADAATALQAWRDSGGVSFDESGALFMEVWRTLSAEEQLHTMAEICKGLAAKAQAHGISAT